MRTNTRYHPHSDISSLGNWNTTFLTLLYTRLTLYSTGDDQCCRTTGIFTKAVQPPSLRQTIFYSNGILVLPSYFYKFSLFLNSTHQ